MTIRLDGESLTIADVVRVARGGEKLEIGLKGQERILACRALVEKLVAGDQPIYGVTTGIGELARIRITPEQSGEMQRRIVLSHSAGTGRVLDAEDVRAAMAIRANVMCKGCVGMRLESVRTYVEMVNRSVVPMVYEKGSVGTSGDLSPMSQLAEVVLGTGQAFYRGELMPGAEAMRRAGLEVVSPSYKEGLGLINGPQMMAGQACLLLTDAVRILKNGLVSSAMAIDALRGRPVAFDAALHALRPFNGQNAAAAAIRKLIEGSEIIADSSGKVQDGYSVRATPQVFGPSIDTIRWAMEILSTEINSGSDNPLFFPEEGVQRAGANFHGQHIGLAMDYAAIAMSEIADLSERHTNRMLNPVLSNGLPDFLVEGKGLNSGLMVAQYTAAAMVSENKILSHPASVDSISVSADQEDHVSMGPNAVRKFREILDNVSGVLAIEMMCAAQAFDFRAPRKPSGPHRAAWRTIRSRVPHLDDDRPLHGDIKAIKEMIGDGSILSAVEEVSGPISLEWAR